MKRILPIALVLCLFVVGFVFAGCGTANDIILSGGPAYEDEIAGNGGMAVTKGDYVYFANGYVSTSDMGGVYGNIKGQVTETGLYRARMTTEVVNEVEQPVLTDVELMVSKTVGFNNSGLYIFKDKIYFASPTTESDSTGVRYDLITFFSCNLDGSNLKSFYQTTEFENGKFSMTMIDGNVYLLVYTGSQIVRIEVNGNATTLASGVTSAILPTRVNISNNEENPNNTECFVYYTVDKETTGSVNLGNILYKAEIKIGVKTELYNEDYISFTLQGVDAGRLFYSRNELIGMTSVYAYYSNTLDKNTFLLGEFKHYSYNTATTTTFLALGEYNSQNLGVAILSGGKIFVRNIDAQDGGKTLVNSSNIPVTSVTKLLFSKDGYLYYLASSKLCRTSLTAETLTMDEFKFTLTLKTDLYDIDYDYFYFFAEDQGKDCAISLYRIKLNGLTNNTPEKMA